MTAPTFVARAVAYARQVTKGEVAAGKYERLACQRFLRDLDRQGSANFPYTFNEAAGNRACVFIELLPHIKGQWAKPEYVNGRMQHGRLRLEAWQIFIVVQLFGWKHQTTGMRRFRRVYLEVARKNAKSTLAAGIALYLLVADNEPGAHVYSAATTGEQAREVFDVARNMALRLPEFQARFGVDIGKHDVTVPETASSFKPLNAEGSTLDGLNIHGAIVDELHAHKTRAVYDVLDSATGARSQPMIVMITTAGSDRSGICYEQRDYTCKALADLLPQGDGLGTDDTWFGIIFTIDDGDNWQDPAVWRKSNPNLGVSVQVDDLQAAIRKAQAQPSSLGNVLTKRLNVWVNADSAWMDMQAWDRCGDRARTADAIGRLPMIGSLDLASKIDVAAKVALHYDQAEDHYYLRTKFWLPSRAVEQGFNSQYDGWRRAKHLEVTDGETIDFDVIEDAIRADVCTNEVLEVAYDPHQATQLVGHMVAEEVPMVEFFGSGGRPTGILNTKADFRKESRDSLRTSFADYMRQSWLKGELPVLDSDTQYTPISTPNNDAQFIETRKLQIAEIARIYRVPLHMLMEMDKASYNNTEQANKHFLDYTLLPYLKRIEQALNSCLLSRSERKTLNFEFDVRGLLRGDSSQRAEYYVSMRNAGAITQNEIRELENMPLIDGADDLLVPLNMAPSDLLRGLLEAKEGKT